MTTERELLQQALQDLMNYAQMEENEYHLGRDLEKENAYPELINNIRTHLAQPVSQEPMAWLFQHDETGRTKCVDVQQVEWGFEKNNPRWQKIGPLYAASPQRKPLTDERIDEIGVEIFGLEVHDDEINAFARAIEAAHGIK